MTGAETPALPAASVPETTTLPLATVNGAPAAIGVAAPPSTDQASPVRPDSPSVPAAMHEYLSDKASGMHVAVTDGGVRSILTAPCAVASLPAPSTARNVTVVEPSTFTVYAPPVTSTAPSPPREAVRTGRPESPPSAATEQTAGVLRHVGAPQLAVRVGAVLSIPTVSRRQPESLPATS